MGGAVKSPQAVVPAGTVLVCPACGRREVAVVPVMEMRCSTSVVDGRAHRDVAMREQG